MFRCLDVPRPGSKRSGPWTKLLLWRRLIVEIRIQPGHAASPIPEDVLQSWLCPCARQGRIVSSFRFLACRCLIAVLAMVCLDITILYVSCSIVKVIKIETVRSCIVLETSLQHRERLCSLSAVLHGHEYASFWKHSDTSLCAPDHASWPFSWSMKIVLRSPKHHRQWWK
jgi:hypothetical protein